MSRFSESCFSKLSTCDLELQTVFFEVIKTIDCIVLEGYRNEEDQNKAFAEKKSKLKFPHSKHNSLPSLATDVAPYPLDWKNINQFYFFAGFVMATAQKLKEIGKISSTLRYGGDWNRNYQVNDEDFRDLVHFELVK